MFTNIPVTKSAPRAASNKTASQSDSDTTVTWRFKDYKKALEFSWNKNFAYPDFSFTVFQRDNLFEVVKKSRPKEETDTEYCTSIRGVHHVSGKAKRRLVKKQD
jgi:hypothetical protein